MSFAVDEQLLIDRAASARRLADEEVRSWGEEQRIFISSVMDGYGESREAAARAIESIGAEPVMFERFGGRDSDPEAAYLAEVESSNIYVGLLGARYGRLLPSRYSATHEEYLHAEKCGLRLSVWTEDAVEREGHQQSFVDDIQIFNVTGKFASQVSLEQALASRLRAIAAEELSPWVKIGRAIFRAKEINVSGEIASLRAAVHDHDVADYLAQLNDRWGSSKTTFAFWDGVYDAKISELSSSTRMGGSREISLDLSISSPQRQNEYSFNGVSYAEGTKFAVEVSWFGQPNPYGIMSSQAEVSNPFTSLARCGVSEESYRSIMQILATEILVRERNIGRIRRLRIGPPVSGQRRVELEWTQPSAYTNHGPEIKGAAGLVAA
jgi:hypothetical protein